MAEKIRWQTSPVIEFSKTITKICCIKPLSKIEFLVGMLCWEIAKELE